MRAKSDLLKIMVAFKSLGKLKKETQCECYDSSKNHTIVRECPESCCFWYSQKFAESGGALVTACFTIAIAGRNHISNMVGQ